MNIKGHFYCNVTMLLFNVFTPKKFIPENMISHVEATKDYIEIFATIKRIKKILIVLKIRYVSLNVIWLYQC